MLKREISFNVLVQPVCLPTLQDVEGRMAGVVGYGMTENISNHLEIYMKCFFTLTLISANSDLPLSIDVNILGSERCKMEFLTVVAEIEIICYV